MESEYSPESTSEILESVFGQRTTETTAAIGFIKSQQGCYLVKQKAVISEKQLINAKDSWEQVYSEKISKWTIIDARNILISEKTRSNQSGFHAEMMVLSAMISANNWDNLRDNYITIKNKIKENGGAIICANAPCCLHCANMLDLLGVEYDEKSKNRGLFGWWNPLTDTVYPNSSQKWTHKVPGTMI